MDRGWKGRLAHGLAILGAALGLAATPAHAQPAVYTTNCTSGCHVTPVNPYPAQLNGAGDHLTGGTVIQHAIGAGMTSVSLTNAELDTLAGYISGFISPVVAQPVSFNAGGGTSTTITLPDITVPSPYGSLSGLATNSASNGSVTSYLTGPARAVFVPTACTTGPGSFTYHGTGPGGTISSNRTQTVSIGNPSSPPTINSGAAPSGQTGVSYTHNMTVSACPLLVTWSLTGSPLPTGLSLNSSTGAITGTPTVVGNFTGIQVTATYVGGQASSQGPFSINITLGPPSITSGASASNTSVGVATAGAYTAAAQYGTMTFGISGQPPGLAINASSGVVSGTPTDASGSPYTATVTASNGVLPNASKSVTFNVVPAINSAATASGQTGVPFTYNITSAPGPAFTSCANLDPLPAGLTRTGCTISGTPTAVGGPTSVRLTGTTAFGGTSAQFTLAITIGLGPPAITSALTASGGEAIAFTPYQITATNTPHTGYNAVGLQSGLSIDTTTGIISGTPASGSAAGSPYSVTISATNATGTGSATLVITISQFAPVNTSLAPPAGQTGVPYSFQITANNGPTSFNAANLPPGLSVNTSNGLISGTPTAVGVFNTATITSSNGAGSDTDTVTFTITLGPPVISSPATAGGAVGFAFTYQIVASNSPTLYGASGLPPGLSINTSTGAITGTPTTNGVYGTTITATNATATASQGLTITIAVGIPVITSAGSAAGATGQAFTFQVTATNGPTSFGATGLPAGLSINTGNGRITGTPTVSGTFTVNLSATNGTGTGTGVLTLTIALTGPVVTSSPTLTVLQGRTTHYQVTAQNCPCTFSATGLPAGLVIDPSSGFIDGTITSPGGAYTVVVTVTNATGSTSFTLTISVGFIVPRAGDLAVNVAFEEGLAITLPVVGDVFTVNIVTLPLHGLVTTQPNSPVVIYTPANGYSGPDSFTYSVTNPAGTSAVATVNITVGTLVPVAGTGIVLVPLNTPTVIEMTKFVRGSQLTGVAITSMPTHGIATVNGLTITYSPRTDYFGADSFAYVAYGGAGASSPATLQIEVTGRPDPTQDRDAMGVAEAQGQAAKRFAGAQIGNYQRRMESLHRAAPAAPATPPQPTKPAAASRANVAARTTETATDAPSEGGTWLPGSLVDTLMRVATTRSLGVSAASDSAGGSGSGFVPGNAFWIAGTANFGNRDAASDRAKLRFDTDGISAGMDRRFSERFAGGIGVGYARDDTDVGERSRSKATGGSIGAYGSYQVGPRTFIDMLLGYGELRFDSRRFVEPADDYATARRKGHQVFGSIAAAYEHRQANLLVSPYARLDFTVDRLDEVSESGAGSFALTYGQATQRSLQAVAGVRAESKHETEFGFAVPRARAEYRRELEGERRITFSYADLIGGPEYTTTPAGSSRNALLLGVGTDLVFRSGLRVGLDYTAQRVSGASNVQGIRLLVSQDLDVRGAPGWRWEPTTFPVPVNVDAGFVWDDNVSRGRDASEKLSDQVFSLGASATRPFTLGAHSRLLVTALGRGEKFERYAGLGNFSAGLQGEVQYRASGAFDAMTFGFVGRALYEQYESSLRTGARYFAGVNARRALTDKIDLFAEAGYNVRNGRSEVFRLRDWSAKVNLDWTPPAPGVVYLTGEFRRGDTVSSGGASLVNADLADVFSPDDAFPDQGFFAYRFEARTFISTLGYNFPLGPRDSLDFSWRRAQAQPLGKPSFDWSGSLRYIDNQYAIVYLMRF